MNNQTESNMSTPLASVPRQDGFFMPAEFAPHDKCWMLWPEREDTWRLQAGPAQKAFANVAKAINRFEPVAVCASSRQLEKARSLLPADIHIIEMESDDAWMRDVGPTFIVNRQGEIRGIDWEFNAWGGLDGGLYYPWERDNLVASGVLESENLKRYKAPLILEGGSIHVDGEGTLLTTEECLLNQNRNPDLSKADIETLLQEHLGVEKIIWLGRGCYEDETDGHVDNLCCFSKPGEVILTWTDDPSDPQYEISQNAYDTLRNAVDARGRSFVIHKLQQPGPLYMTEEESRGLKSDDTSLPREGGERLAGSYVNFYLANGGVVVPQFNDPRDLNALETLGRIFPDRQVVGVQSREILLGGGNIHCITQQQPKGIV